MWYRGNKQPSVSVRQVTKSQQVQVLCILSLTKVYVPISFAESTVTDSLHHVSKADNGTIIR
jgi:hypothetical protein